MNTKAMGHLLAAFAVTLASVGCSGDSELEGNGVVTTETRTVEQFVRIENRGSYDVRITPGAAFGLTVSIDENLLPMVRTSVENGTLILDSTEPIDPSGDGASVVVTLPDLQEVLLSGTGDVDVTTFAHPNPLRLQVTGDGDLDFTGSAPLLVVGNGGTGDLELFGSVERVEISANGTGDVDGEGLVAKSGAVTLTGAGDVSATVQETVDVTAKGSGDVEVHGGATVGTMIHEGSGDVNVR